MLWHGASSWEGLDLKYDEGVAWWEGLICRGPNGGVTPASLHGLTRSDMARAAHGSRGESMH